MYFYNLHVEWMFEIRICMKFFMEKWNWKGLLCTTCYLLDLIAKIGRLEDWFIRHDLLGLYALRLVSQVVFIYSLICPFVYLILASLSSSLFFSFFSCIQFATPTVCSSLLFQEELDLRCSGTDIIVSIEYLAYGMLSGFAHYIIPSMND